MILRIGIVMFSELHITTHAYIPHQVWSVLMASCPGLSCLELTSCEGLWDGSLAATMEASPTCLANLTRSENTSYKQETESGLGDKNRLSLVKKHSLCI